MKRKSHRGKRVAESYLWKRMIALKWKNNSINYDTANKEKGKAIINDEEHLDYFNEYWIRCNQWETNFNIFICFDIWYSYRETNFDMFSFLVEGKHVKVYFSLVISYVKNKKDMLKIVSHWLAHTQLLWWTILLILIKIIQVIEIIVLPFSLFVVFRLLIFFSFFPMLMLTFFSKLFGYSFSCLWFPLHI